MHYRPTIIDRFDFLSTRCRYHRKRESEREKQKHIHPIPFNFKFMLFLVYRYRPGYRQRDVDPSFPFSSLVGISSGLCSYRVRLTLAGALLFETFSLSLFENCRVKFGAQEEIPRCKYRVEKYFLGESILFSLVFIQSRLMIYKLANKIEIINVWLIYFFSLSYLTLYIFCFDNYTVAY